MSPGPIRVLQLINSLGMGGAEKRLSEIVAGLPPEEFAFHVCCLSATGPYEGRIRLARAPIEVLGYRGLRSEGRFRIQRLAEPLRMIRLFRGVVERVQPHVVQTWIPISNFIGGRAVARWRFRRIALVASRVFTGEYREANPLIPLAEGWASRRADLVYCNCAAVRDDTIRREPSVDPASLRVIRNGVDPNRFAPREDRSGLRKKLGLEDEDLAVATVAALRGHKGHADLLRAARWVVERLPRARFLLVGPDQGEGQRLRRLAEELALGAAVEFLGPRADIAEILAAADLLALPSLEEGLPNVLLEAQAAGLACVATDLPGCAEALAEGETGVLVPARNPQRMAEALWRLLGDAELRRRMGQAARRRAVREFSMEAMLGQFAALYREAAGIRARAKS
jgi:glycosyltransferase involved in cell wall biosynthesis